MLAEVQIMKFAIKRTARAVSVFITAAVMSLFTLNAFADTPKRSVIDDADYISAVDGAFERELKKLGSENLCYGFLQSGAAESEADWYMLSALAVGRDEDYAAYEQAAGDVLAEKLKNPDEYYITEFARTAVVIQLCGGESPDLSELDLTSAGDNEVIWAALAQKLGGYDCTQAQSELASRQSEDGGFGIAGASDADITAMALNVLPKDGEQASAALQYLKNYYMQNGADISTETAAQMIIGLCSQGINPSQSADFTDGDGVRLIDILFSRRADDGFSHLSDGEANDMSTMQALTALAALGFYSETGSSVFEANLDSANFYGGKKLCGEAFDEYDIGVLESVEDAEASDYNTLTSLRERAEALDADEETLSEIDGKLAESELICEEIEELNAEIREDFYPADGVGLKKLSRLHSLNERISHYSDNDRELILSADELEEREDALRDWRKNLITASCGGLLLAAAAAIYIMRKNKHE
jgi:hypothetical protein